jgi:pimeloyl-ACP methyl ester carboxylesterase
VVGPAIASGLGPMVDDDLAYVSPWGCDPQKISRPVLLLHGDQDRMVPSSHGAWLAGHCPSAEFWVRPGDGHISVLSAGAAALDWLQEHAS